MSFILGLFKGVWGYIAAAGAAVAAFVAIYFSAKKSGATEVVADTQKKELENVQKANEIDRDIVVSKPDDVQRRLRDKWSRD